MSTTKIPNNPTPKTGGEAATNNWDTVFAINFRNANKAIKQQKSSPPAFSGTRPGGGFSGPTVEVDGIFGDWQLSGGSGSLAEMSLPISGKATALSVPAQVINFSGTAIIQVSLTYIPQRNNTSSPTETGGINNALRVNTNTTDPQAQPIVSVTSVEVNQEASEAALDISFVLGKWLSEHLDSFTHTFAAIDLGALADKGAFQWLAPTKVGYGINNPENAEVEDYIFAVMAMTENRQGVNLGHEVSPNIIPQGCNAGFLISQERFMRKILLPGIEGLFLKASASDFSITGDGSTITNINPLTFQNFVTSNKSGTDKVNITGATLDAGKFSLIASATNMMLNFTDLHFLWNDGGYTVHMDYVSQCELYMDSNKHFQAYVVGTPSLAVTVTESSERKWTNIIEGMIEGIAFATIGAAIGGALGPAAEAAGEEIDEGAATAAESVEDTANALEFSTDLLADDEVPNLDELNSEDDADASEDMINADSESYQAKFNGFFRRNWRKILGIAIGGATGAVTAKIPDILEYYSEQDLEKMPTLDEFVDYSVSPVAWPGQTSYTLISAALNESLQIGLNVNITD